MQFLYSNVLLLMLIPALILMYLIIKKQSSLERFFTKEVYEKLSVSNQYLSNKARNIILFFSLIFMIIALARPVANEKNVSTQEELKSIIIALDVSKSMKAIDVYPNRLEFAKKKLLDIIEYSKQNAIGIILFAKSSYILSPITQDFSSLKILVENLDTGMNFDNGTNIYSVLETSNKLFESYSNKNLLILSDGGDSEDFKEEIEYANENKINIYSMAIATQNGAAVKLENGNFLTDKAGKIVNLKLNDKIKELSLNTNGGHINFTLDDSDFKQIIDDINSKSSKDKFEQQRFKVYTELFYYPLAIGIFLLLIAFSSLPRLKKTSSIIILFLSIFYTQSLKAGILDFQTIKEAKKNYDSEKYEEAIKDFSKIDSNTQRDYDLANSYYKAKNYDKAIELYENIKSDDLDINYQRLHNLGNAQAFKGDYEKAIKTYEDALKLKNDSQTKENLELLKKMQDEQKNQQQQQNENKNQENKNDKKEDKQQQNNDNQEEKNDNQKEKQKEQNQKDSKENNKQEQNQENIDNSKEEKETPISNYEEEKWMKQLEKQKTNSLLKKMNTSNEGSSKNPW